MSLEESRRVYSEAKRIHMGTLMQELVGKLDAQGIEAEQIDVVNETYSEYDVEPKPIQADEEITLMLRELRHLFNSERIIIDVYNTRYWDITKTIQRCVEVG